MKKQGRKSKGKCKFNVNNFNLKKGREVVWQI